MGRSGRVMARRLAAGTPIPMAPVLMASIRTAPIRMASVLMASVLVVSVSCVGCSRQSRSPDAIRNDTANVTSAATRDAKAVALGVVDGLRRRGPVNINKAGREELQTLPGISAARADAIIAHRPYQSASALLRRHILTKAEYNQIADRITAR